MPDWQPQVQPAPGQLTHSHTFTMLVSIGSLQEIVVDRADAPHP
jgi:hypothetical protein